MPYELNQFDPAEVDAMLAERRAALKANLGRTDLAGYALGVFWRRLQREPGRYRDYGPYWWAVKSLLRNAGFPVDDETDPVVEAAYRGSTPEATIIMADAFRDGYLATQSVGTAIFQLSEDEVPYVLEDSGMDALR